MASPVIKIKRSSVQNNAPTAAQLELGELALNTYDGKLFTEINDGTVSIVEIGGHLQHLAVSGISTFTGNIDANGAANISGDLTIADKIVHDGDTDTAIRFPSANTFSVELGGSEKLNMGSYAQFNQLVYINDTLQVSGQLQVADSILHMNNSPTRIRFPENNVIELKTDNAVGLRLNQNQDVNVAGIITSTGLDINGNIDVSGTVDGRDLASDGSKLDGIESGASADQTASEILTLIKTVDGAGSGLDADTLDGVSSDGFVAVGGDTMTGNLIINNTSPSLTLTDSNNNPDYQIGNSNGTLRFRDTNAASNRMTITSSAVDINVNLDANSGLDVTGNISVSGTVDGRDVASDGSKLDGIASGATNVTNNNQLTNGAGYITATLTNEQVQDIVGGMLSGNTESGITVTYQDGDGTIDFSVASQTDNNFTNADHSKLDGIEAGADVTDATNVNAAGAVMNSDSTTASMNFVVDEDNMSSDSATKVPTQQSVKAYVDSEVSGLVDSAPGALNTLNELAAALGDDANFSTTVTNSIATKLPLGGGTMTGNIVMSGSQTVDGRDLSVDGSKLDGIESGATADQSASEILTLIKTVDGAGSGLDADTLDGISSGSFIRSDATDTVSGELTFTNDANFTGDVYISDTGTDSSAGPILDLYRNSSSPADADYLGQIKFQGKNDAGQKLVYSKITGKILDASDGTEDGIIEFAFKKAGSNNISGRFRSDSLQLLNGTNFTVAGDSTLTGGLDVDGHTEVDNLKSVGIATFSNNAIHANVYSTGISTISGFRFPTADGDEDQALVTDGNGQLSFKTLSGGGGGATGAATTISAGIQTATQGQTVFSTPHPHNDGTNTFSTQVFVNGLKFRPQGAGSSKDFTTSSNSTITMEDGLSVGDEVVSVVYFGHTIDEEYFTATQGQVLFPLSGSLSAQKNFRVFVNGTKLRNGDDYGVAAPVTLVVPCAEGAEVEIVCDNAEDKFTATDQQTNFTPTSTDISTSNMQVYVNGLQLFKGIDFSIGSPSVTLTDAAGLTVGDEVDVCIRRTA